MLKKATNLMLLTFTILFVGCGLVDTYTNDEEYPNIATAYGEAQPVEPIATPLTESLNSDEQDYGESSDMAIVGITYSDLMFRMSVVINNTDWIYYRLSNPEQAYFFNNTNPCRYSLISISAFPFLGDVYQEITRLWDEMLENHANSPMEHSFVYQERQAITVGEGQYSGYLHSFEATFEGTLLMFNAVFWNADGMMYICTTSSDENNAKEVHSPHACVWRSCCVERFPSVVARF